MRWAFLTRSCGERDLLDELGERAGAEAPVEGLVLAERRPRAHDGPLAELAFARQAMRIATDAPAEASEVARALAELLTAKPKSARRREDQDEEASGGTWSLQLAVPDSTDPRDPKRRTLHALEETLPAALAQALPEALRAQERADGRSAARLAQVWVVGPELVLLGVTRTTQALSPHPAGKLHLERAIDAPSRAGLKLEEAIDWIGVGPEKSDLCVDLGAAPGGWSQVAVARGAAVIAVDPGPIKIELPERRFTHLREDAFDFAPPETVDWLLCDMAWRPLEVAKMVAKWGRRGWARQFIANFKLPMTQKAAILAQILEILRDAGWEGLRARQLYHDRDEVTLYAWLRAGLVQRGHIPAFELRSRGGRAGGERRGEPRATGPRKKKVASKAPKRKVVRSDKITGPREEKAAAKPGPKKATAKPGPKKATAKAATPSASPRKKAAAPESRRGTRGAARLKTGPRAGGKRPGPRGRGGR